LGEDDGVAELSFLDGLLLGAAPQVASKNSRICIKDNRTQ
jgi:hypothetical protein